MGEKNLFRIIDQEGKVFGVGGGHDVCLFVTHLPDKIPTNFDALTIIPTI